MSLIEHMESGVTTIARCWILRRRDGLELGFTDHDSDLEVAGATCAGGVGLSGGALDQSTGLAVDNTEVLGALSGAGITEAEIEAGLFDGAQVECWHVNWEDPGQARRVFRGSIGEVSRGGGAFRAELRGLSETLNRPQGRVYQGTCPATLGDARCGVDIGATGLVAEGVVSEAEAGRLFTIADLPEREDHLFRRGRIEVLSGEARGVSAQIRNDRERSGSRRIELWEPLGRQIAIGDRVRLSPGCDKRLETCRTRFGNAANFRGFPHMPGEDWLMAYPVAGAGNDGGPLT